MNHSVFFNTPYGAKDKKIPMANNASTATSKTLVSHSDQDAFFFRALESKGIFLNAPQIEAVKHYKGPILALSGAGVGKTTLIASRTAYLISVHEVSPKQILLVTFTKKAANEMKERISRLPGLTPSKANQITASTFHAFFFKLLKSQGYDQQVLKEDRKRVLIKLILKEVGLKDKYPAETVQAYISGFKLHAESFQGAVDNELHEVFKQYEEWRISHHYLDFDDMLLEAYQLLKRSPGLLQKLRDRFQFVAVDEFQDTNDLQYKLVKMIVHEHNNIFVVGDPDQTIYSFNGAKYDYIMEFDTQFPNTQVVTMDTNYRSIPSIVGLGNAIIEHNQYRKEKSLKASLSGDGQPQYVRPSDTDDEAKIITDHIKMKVQSGYAYSDIAVLYRTSSSGRAILEQFIMDDLLFTVSHIGESFYEQSFVKPLIDHLRLSIDHRDIKAIEGILPSMYINRDKGKKHIEDSERARRKKYPLIHLKTLEGIPAFQKDKISERIALIKNIADMKPVRAIRVVREQVYDKYVETDDKQPFTTHKEMITETLDELESSAKRFDTIPNFLAHIADMVNKYAHLKQHASNDSHAVRLSTIHASKGLEFPIVYVIGMSDGILPHSSSFDDTIQSDRQDHRNGSQLNHALEEERRLAYVAVTRAQKELYLSSPRYYRGKEVTVSEFLRDVFHSSEMQSSRGKIRENRPSLQHHHASSGKGSRTTTVDAWLCTNSECKGWMRMSTHQESLVLSRECAICNSPMKRGSKTI